MFLKFGDGLHGGEKVGILNIQREVNDLTFSTKFIMKTVKEKIDVRDQEEWYDEPLNDR